MIRFALRVAALLLAFAPGVHAADKITNYICEDGTKLPVEFTDRAANISLPDGSKLELPQQAAASGTWYSSGRHELRSKGDEATWAVGRKAPTKCKVDAALEQGGNFTLPKLNYAFNALAPVIDVKTMETHYGKHHQAYIDNLNREVANTPALQGKSLEEILAHVTKYNAAVRNNAGGHWNHAFFWRIMAPEKLSGQPSAELLAAIEKTFGSMDAFRSAFEKAGTGQFGSGWVWLVADKSGELKITATPNQDNPLMNDAKVKGTPILGNDVWEHAYYLNYQNRRADYLKNWWRVVDWQEVSENYKAATSPAAR